MSDVFSLYPHAPPPQQVKSPAETINEVAGAGVRINQMKLQQLQLHTGRLQNLNQTIAGLLADPSTTREDVRRVIMQKVAEGVIDSTGAANAISDLAKIPAGNPQQEKAGVRQYLITRMAQNLDAGQQATSALGPAGWQQLGSQVQPVVGPSIFPGGPGGRPAGEPFNIAPAPGDFVEQWNPKTNRMEKIPKQAVMPQAGQGAGGGAASPGAVVTAPSDQEKASIAQHQNERQFSSQYIERSYALSQALPILQQLKEAGAQAGPGTVMFNNFKQALIGTKVIDSGSAAKNTSDLTAEVNKYLVQNQAMLSAGGTDLAKIQTVAGNADLKMGLDPAINVGWKQIGLLRYQAMLPAVADKPGPWNNYDISNSQNQNYTSWKSGIQPQIDPNGTLIKDPNVPLELRKSIHAAIPRGNAGAAAKRAAQQAGDMWDAYQQGGPSGAPQAPPQGGPPPVQQAGPEEQP